MSLSNEQIASIQTSFAAARDALGDEAIGSLLFAKIFKAAPEAREMFPESETAMIKHGAGVVKAVGTAVRNLENTEKLVKMLNDMGKRHKNYGVVDAHYPIVGAAFLGTLEDGLGDQFTPELKVAYTNLWAIVQETMLAGANKK